MKALLTTIAFFGAWFVADNLPPLASIFLSALALGFIFTSLVLLILKWVRNV